MNANKHPVIEYRDNYGWHLAIFSEVFSRGHRYTEVALFLDGELFTADIDADERGWGWIINEKLRHSHETVEIVDYDVPMHYVTRLNEIMGWTNAVSTNSSTDIPAVSVRDLPTDEHGGVE